MHAEIRPRKYKISGELILLIQKLNTVPMGVSSQGVVFPQSAK